MIWNQIRRQVTRDIDTEIQNRREVVLNVALGQAWKEFRAALETGDIKAVQAKYADFATAIVNDVVPEGLLASVVEDR